MDTFDLNEARALLAATPRTLDSWLRDLPAAWLRCDEGPQTWDAHGVVGHLIEAELHDWIPRTRHLFEHGEAVPFPPFDRFAQQNKPERTIAALLDEFALLRDRSLRELDAMHLGDEQLQRCGTHPEFGRVTLGQLLATWVAHDLTHITQIARVQARRYRAAVGPWRRYLRVVADAGGAD